METNNSFSVKVEASDRRYLVLNCSNERVGQHQYFEDLRATFTDEFFSNLLTFFLKMDLTGFKIKNIPMTEAKQDLIEASRPIIDIWIIVHYNELVAGVKCSEALDKKPKELRPRSFQLILKDKCECKQINREWYYILKPDIRYLYKPKPEE
jgi:hypothetical protein